MSVEEEHKYDDIINLPHYVSPRHPQMPLSNRAAQFSPFAALTGHSEAIEETARLTEEKAELEEDAKELLDKRLRMLREALKAGQGVEAEVTYFKQDGKKNGGAYITLRGQVSKIDEYERQLVFADRTEIPLEDLVSVEGKLQV